MVKKWRSSFLAVLMVLAMAILAGCGGSDTTTATESGETTTAKVESKTSFAVGESYEDRSVKITFVSANDDFTNYSRYAEIPAGYKVVEAIFTFENKGSDDFLATDMDFTCYADNESCDNFYSVNDTYMGFSDNLSSGKTASNRAVYFTVPENASSIVLEYETDFWSGEKIQFVIK